MKYTENGNFLKELYLENSNVNWVEGTFHFWGECVFPNEFTVKVNRKLENDILSEEFVFTNNSDKDITFNKGEIGVWATFNDSYEGATVCKDKKCHTFLEENDGAYCVLCEAKRKDKRDKR